jgi:hypothetical protein
MLSSILELSQANWSLMSLPPWSRLRKCK